jgi:flagellin
MALTSLNNISSLSAENALSNTQANLQKTLTQLSTGLKINSGADDAAGLSIANGLQANIAALTQSSQNASNSIGMLQTADGALSQVTTLLNRGVTLATEAANAGLTTGATGSTQAAALNNEYQSILTEIGQIGSSTNFNGTAVFGTAGAGAGSQSIAMSDGTVGGIGGSVSVNAGGLTTAGLGLAAGAGTVGTGTYAMTAQPTDGQTVVAGGTTYKFVSTLPGTADTTAVDIKISGSAAQDAQNLTDAINGTNNAAVDASGLTGYTHNTQVSAAESAGTLTITSLDGSAHAVTGTYTASTNTTMSVSGASAATDLSNTSDAKTALTALTNAVNVVSAQRGTIGAAINQLTAASAVMNNEVQNLTSAQNSVQNADIGKTVANMTQYNVLQSTGMAALQQSNQAQQAVLKLVQ